jgi:hypothetical protein
MLGLHTIFFKIFFPPAEPGFGKERKYLLFTAWIAVSPDDNKE